MLNFYPHQHHFPSRFGSPVQAELTKPVVRWLDDAELLRLLDEMPQRPMLAGQQGLRLSLAGAQDKLPVVAADGNHDAHAKNFSILYGHAGAGLAPLYDTLSTAVYAHLSDKMAMKIGGKYRFTEVMPALGAIRARRWSVSCPGQAPHPGDRPPTARPCPTVPDRARDTLARFDAQGDGHPVLGQFVALTAQRCELSIRRLGAPAADSA